MKEDSNRSPQLAGTVAKPLSSEHLTARLVGWFDAFTEVDVAFSGGVDSSVVLAAAQRSNARRVVAITARSPSVPAWQLDMAVEVARHIRVRHEIIETHELDSIDYVANRSDRCFHCKTTLYTDLARQLELIGVRDADRPTDPQQRVVVSGTNADDLGDHRPGIRAGQEHGIQTPLAELGIGKAQVREIARAFALPNAELPASPCLASRIAYGVSVTVDRLSRIEQAESFLRSLGMEDVRVRLHTGELARIEVPANRIADLARQELRDALSQRLQELGFQYVTLDLEGLSSGSMNRPLVSLSINERSKSSSRPNSAVHDSAVQRLPVQGDQNLPLEKSS